MVKPYTSVALCLLVGSLLGACVESAGVVTEEGGDIFIEEFLDKMPNNTFRSRTAHGFAATFCATPATSISITTFFTPQGTNGRQLWRLPRARGRVRLQRSDGDGAVPPHRRARTRCSRTTSTRTPRPSDMSTLEARWKATTMLRQGKFVRKVAPPANRDYDVIAIERSVRRGHDVDSCSGSAGRSRRRTSVSNTVMSDGGFTTGRGAARRPGSGRPARQHHGRGAGPGADGRPHLRDRRTTRLQLFARAALPLGRGAARRGPARRAARSTLASAAVRGGPVRSVRRVEAQPERVSGGRSTGARRCSTTGRRTTGGAAAAATTRRTTARASRASCSMSARRGPSTRSRTWRSTRSRAA